MNHTQKQFLYFCVDGHYHTIGNNDAFEKMFNDEDDGYLDSKDSLSEKNVSASHVNILIDWVSRVDHQTINKLHGLGSLTSQLATDHHLATLGSGLHDEPQHTIAGSPDSQASDQLVPERLSLSNGAETTSGDLRQVS